MSDMITVRVKNVLGTEETDVRLPTDATIGQLLQQAAPQLQINPQGATILYQGQQLPLEWPLDKAMIRDGDAVLIAPGLIVGGGCSSLPFDMAFQYLPCFQIPSKAEEDSISSQDQGALRYEIFNDANSICCP